MANSLEIAVIRRLSLESTMLKLSVTIFMQFKNLQKNSSKIMILECQDKKLDLVRFCTAHIMTIDPFTPSHIFSHTLTNMPIHTSHKCSHTSLHKCSQKLKHIYSNKPSRISLLIKLHSVSMTVCMY